MARPGNEVPRMATESNPAPLPLGRESGGRGGRQKGRAVRQGGRAVRRGEEGEGSHTQADACCSRPPCLPIAIRRRRNGITVPPSILKTLTRNPRHSSSGPLSFQCHNPCLGWLRSNRPLGTLLHESSASGCTFLSTEDLYHCINTDMTIHTSETCRT